MDKRFSSEIPLLSTNEVCDDNEKLNISSRKLATRYEPYRQQVLIAVSCIALASLSLNVVLILPQVSQTSSFSTLEGISAYTGLGLDVPSVHFHHTDYWSPNQTRADELWEGIDTNPMVVALTDEFADLHGLPHSDRFPWDKSKGRYFVKVFHQLHCLKFIRRAFVDYQRGVPPELNGQHVHHCLDTLRQDVTCMADDTPMPTGDEARAIGDEQPMMCRNLDKLRDWIYAPERHACHRALDDYRSITHSIERYAFCQNGSANFVEMQRYFDKYGHVDPWS